jgi:hypothetical protein
MVEPTPQPLPAQTVEPEAPGPPVEVRPGAVGLLMGFGITGAAATAGSWLAGRRRSERTTVVRRGLLGVVGGMVGYLLHVLAVVRPESWPFWPEAAWASAAGLSFLVAGGALLAMLLPVPRAGGRS